MSSSGGEKFGAGLEALKRWREDEQRALEFQREHGRLPHWFQVRVRKAKDSASRPVGERAYLEKLENEYWEDTGKPALKAAYPDDMP